MLKRQRIVFLMFNGCDLLDVSGPTSVFHCAARQLLMSGATSEFPFDFQFLSPEGGLITTLQGLPLLTAPLRDFSPGEIDTVLVVGGAKVEVSCDERLVDWIRRNHTAAQRVASVCTGAFILALAGLLEGRRAVTHWEDCELLQRRFPSIDVDPNSIFTQDDHIWTSAGVSSGIDMALAMIEQDYGHELALIVARRQVVFLKRPGGQSQFSTALQGQSVVGTLGPLLKWIAENPAADLRAEVLAERANMSLRNFYRAFDAATGGSPAEWVEATRTEVAKRLLEQTTHNVDQIAVKAGFGTYERMRRTFARRVGVTPGDYRERFSSKSLAAPGGDVYLSAIYRPDLAAAEPVLQ